MGRRDKRRRRKRGAPAGGKTPTVTTNKANPPPRERLLESRTIRVGDVEDLPGGGQLRCAVDGDRVIVAVFDGEVAREPILHIDRAAGEVFDEGEFSRVLDSYTINSPWHDGEYTCLVLTVDCLRHGREPKLLTFKDL